MTSSRGRRLRTRPGGRRPADIHAFVPKEIGQGRHVRRGRVIEYGEGTAGVNLQLAILVASQFSQRRQGGARILADPGQRQGSGAAHVAVLVLEQAPWPLLRAQTFSATLSMTS